MGSYGDMEAQGQQALGLVVLQILKEGCASQGNNAKKFLEYEFMSVLPVCVSTDRTCQLAICVSFTCFISCGSYLGRIQFRGSGCDLEAITTVGCSCPWLTTFLGLGTEL